MFWLPVVFPVFLVCFPSTKLVNVQGKVKVYALIETMWRPSKKTVFPMKNDEKNFTTDFYKNVSGENFIGIILR